VGLAAIKLANKVGAISIALTRGGAKRKSLVDARAAHVIATDEQDLVKEIRSITGGKGARIVFDPVGGSDDQQADGGNGQAGHDLHLWRLEHRANSAAAL